MLLMALTLMVMDPPPQPMTVDVIRDPITDRVRAFATQRDGQNRIVVSCDPGRYPGYRVAIHSNRWLARGNILSGERPITYRFDDLEPRRNLWDIDDRRALLSGTQRASNFVAHLLRSTKLAVRVSDIEDHRFDMMFRLTDVAPAMRWMDAVCSNSARRR